MTLDEKMTPEKQSRRAWLFVGLGLVAYYVLIQLFRTLFKIFVSPLTEGMTGLGADIVSMLGTFGVMYFLAQPLSYLVMRIAPREKIEEKKLGFGKFLVFFFVAFFFMFAGAMISLVINAVVSGFTGLSSNESVSDVFSNVDPILMFAISAVLGPIAEELLFRKFIIDRTHAFGGTFSVVLSGVMFGLFHGNIQQMIGAAAAGMLFGYIYLKTGRIRYSIIIHIGVNTFASLVQLFTNKLGLAEISDAATLGEIPGDVMNTFLALLGSEIVYFCFVVIGIVLFCVYVKEVRIPKGRCELTAGKNLKSAFLNVGMILYLLLCAYMVVCSFYPNFSLLKFLKIV